jgi:hypothetical protein
MFAYKSYLKLGDFSGTDILSLQKSAYEITDCKFSFYQGIDKLGKASTEVHGGTIKIALSMLPTKEIIEWGMLSRKYKNGVLVVLDEHDIPQEKILFENAACVNMEIHYTQKGNSYAATTLVLHSEKLMFGNGLDFDNNWVK